jgi:hypothetical protein
MLRATVLVLGTLRAGLATHPESEKRIFDIRSFLEVALSRHSFSRGQERRCAFDTARSVGRTPNTSRSKRSSFCALFPRVLLSRAEPPYVSVILIARGGERPEGTLDVRSTY